MSNDLHFPGCSGKRAFDSMKAALRRARLMRQKYDEPLVAYRCPHCRKVHIGGRDE